MAKDIKGINAYSYPHNTKRFGNLFHQISLAIYDYFDKYNKRAPNRGLKFHHLTNKNNSLL